MATANPLTHSIKSHKQEPFLRKTAQFPTRVPRSGRRERAEVIKLQVCSIGGGGGGNTEVEKRWRV